MQSSYNSLYLKEKIQTVYVAPVLNDSPTEELGVVVYNALYRTLSAHRSLFLVRDPSGADAVLQAYVRRAAFSALSTQRAGDLGPKKALSDLLPEPNRLVPAQYLALLGCSFKLTKKNKQEVWSLALERTQAFPATLQLGVPGHTQVFMHQGSFVATLTQLAQKMMEEVHEALLGFF